MRFLRVIPVVLLLMLLPACNPYEKENERLNDEIKMARQENDFLKAQIVGLKKELDQLGAKMKAEREALEKQFDEDRRQMETKLQEECEAALKKAQEAPKGQQEPRKPARQGPDPQGKRCPLPFEEGARPARFFFWREALEGATSTSLSSRLPRSGPSVPSPRRTRPFPPPTGT